MTGFNRLAMATLLVLVPTATSAQDVPFLESPDYIVAAMLDLAEVTENDIVYDLGSGDGRIVIAAAVDYGARGVGIESNAGLVDLSIANARAAGVEDRVRFVLGDIFEEDFSEATVVAIFLYPKVNRRLRPILMEQLAPGTRIVSHRYGIDGWTPVKRIKKGGRDVFLYIVPDRAGPWGGS